MIRFILAALLLAAPTQAQPVTANVPLGPFRPITVIDGDSVVMSIPGGFLTGVRVRLIGIDAPERHGQCPAEIALATAATEALRLLAVAGVALVTGMEVDRYGRLLGRLYDREGRDLALVMVERGLARAYDGRSARLGWCP